MSSARTPTLIASLEVADEHTRLEVKRGAEVGKSLLETICAFSNEPGLDGGTILLGVSKSADNLYGNYEVVGVPDPDKLQADLAVQCAQTFNHNIRPRITVETVNEKAVVVIDVEELDISRKPLFFTKTGLPRGAWRRIGSTDQRCTEDDIRSFHEAARSPSPELDAVSGTSIQDVDPAALKLYRRLREKANAQASELNEEDHELLLSLNCLTDGGQLTLAGLVLFGKSRVLRRELPAFRLDYVRVPGNEWIGNADERFATLDMRECILLLVNRAVAAVEADLPKQFHLAEGDIQAQYHGVPNRALREVIVNALMHQSFRVHQPIQVVRFHNRIEVGNGGHSLKPQSELGTRGSKLRNPAIAAVLHDLNIAENKGSGIATVRDLMRQADFAPPTFVSNRASDSFDATLSLQHFWDEDTLRWLERFDRYHLNRPQRKALVHLRDDGTINNERYREINDVDTFKASNDLRGLRNHGLVEMKGGGSQTYYEPTAAFANGGVGPLHRGANGAVTPLDRGNTPPQKGLKGGGTPPPKEDTPPHKGLKRGGTPPPKDDTPPPKDDVLVLPERLAQAIARLPARVNDRRALWKIVQRLCAIQPMSSREIAGYIGKKEKYVRDRVLPNVRAAGLIAYLYPDEPYRAEQAYIALDNPDAELEP